MANENSVPFDLAEAHRHFSADCFNRTWTLIEKPTRTSGEDEEMILCALASLWHWTQRTDVTDRNLSVGHWQASRAFALIGQGDNAMRHAQHSLHFAGDLSPFYVGYAHEAVARAAVLLNDRMTFQVHLQKARSAAAMVGDDDERTVLEKDLLALAAANKSTR